MIYVWLDARQLEAAGACADGIAIVRRLAAAQGRRRKARLRWDALGAAWAWDVYPSECSWLAERGLIPPSVTGDGGTAVAGYGGCAAAGVGGIARAGEHGTATAGDYGHATAGGYGHAIAGHHGTATAGDYGHATAGGYGAVTVGAYGTAAVGYRGRARAGHGGAIVVGSVVGRVGRDGILQDTWYCARDGRLVPC